MQPPCQADQTSPRINQTHNWKIENCCNVAEITLKGLHQNNALQVSLAPNDRNILRCNFAKPVWRYFNCIVLMNFGDNFGRFHCRKFERNIFAVGSLCSLSSAGHVMAKCTGVPYLLLANSSNARYIYSRVFVIS